MSISSKNMVFLQNYKKREVGNFLLLKFLSRIALVTDNAEKTRKSLEKYLDRQPSTMTYILEVLEDFLIKPRDRSIKGRKYEQFYFDINWEVIIRYLVSETIFPDQEKQLIIDYCLNGIHILQGLQQELAKTGTTLQSFIPLENEKVQFWLFLIDIQPANLFFVLLINYVASLLNVFTVKSASPPIVLEEATITLLITLGFLPIPKAVINFLMYYSFEPYLQAVLQQLRNVEVKGKTLTAKLPSIDQQVSEPPKRKESSDWAVMIQLLYIAYQLGSPILQTLPDIDQDQPIQITIPLKDGTTITKQTSLNTLKKFFIL